VTSRLQVPDTCRAAPEAGAARGCTLVVRPPALGWRGGLGGGGAATGGFGGSLAGGSEVLHRPRRGDDRGGPSARSVYVSERIVIISLFLY